MNKYLRKNIDNKSYYTNLKVLPMEKKGVSEILTKFFEEENTRVEITETENGNINYKYNLNRLEGIITISDTKNEKRRFQVHFTKEKFVFYGLVIFLIYGITFGITFIFMVPKYESSYPWFLFFMSYSYILNIWGLIIIIYLFLFPFWGIWTNIVHFKNQRAFQRKLLKLLDKK
ncbi:MAG: hypothetical protein ACTSSI_10025 [Candidatus Helarchaeota archaeon]